MKIPPIIKIVIGFILGIGAYQLHTKDMYLDTGLAIIGLVGLVIFIQGMRELRKKGGKNYEL